MVEFLLQNGVNNVHKALSIARERNLDDIIGLLLTGIHDIRSEWRRGQYDSLLPCTCNAVFSSLLPSCICTCYAHTSLAHTYTVVTMHTHKLANLHSMHSTQLYHCHTLLAHAFSFVCSIHTLYAVLNF